MARRLGQRLAGSGLGRQVNNEIGACLGEKRVPHTRLSDVYAAEIDRRVQGSGSYRLCVYLRVETVEYDHVPEPLHEA
jgi:hypothetical protein